MAYSINTLSLQQAFPNDFSFYRYLGEVCECFCIILIINELSI
jgi:hypothetical protein